MSRRTSATRLRIVRTVDFCPFGLHFRWPEFLEGEVFLWDVAGAGEGEWKKEWFEVFEAVKPRPGMYLHFGV